MVFCGKPSKGCAFCRERKIRCDQVPEGCTQCAKASRQCPGYRDQLDLMFRNESRKVINKAKAQGARQKPASSGASQSSSSFKSSTSSDWDDLPTEEIEPWSGELYEPRAGNLLELVRREKHDASFPTSLPSTFSIAPSVEDLATGFFFANYVIDVRGPTRGHLNRLHDIYNTYDMDENLLASMKAVGLAGCSHFARSPQLMKDARKQYTKALHLTNEALRSPTDFKKDSTLLAIMVLSIFETVTGCNTKSFTAWAQHINGAAALISLRGSEQLRTPAGRGMFVQATSNLLISCIQRRLPVPTHIMEMRAEAVKHMQTFEPGWTVQQSMIAFTNFRAEMRTGAISDPREILSKCLEIDGILLPLFLNAPQGWEYQTIFTDDADPDLVYDGCYHIYYDQWIAQLWNAMRTVRAMLNEQIRDVILAGLSAKPPLFLGPEYTAQLQISIDVILQMQVDILRSVPQNLGFAGIKHASSHASPDSQSFVGNYPSKSSSLDTNFINSGNPLRRPDGSLETPMIRAAGGYFLMWPLFLAGVLDLTSKSSQRWAAHMLRYIAKTMGIQQALVAAEFVEKQEEIKEWN